MPDMVVTTIQACLPLGRVSCNGTLELLGYLHFEMQILIQLIWTGPKSLYVE